MRVAKRLLKGLCDLDIPLNEYNYIRTFYLDSPWLWQMQLDKANILGRLLGWISVEGILAASAAAHPHSLSNISTLPLYKSNIKPLTSLAGHPQNIFTMEMGKWTVIVAVISAPGSLSSALEILFVEYLDNKYCLRILRQSIQFNKL